MAGLGTPLGFALGGDQSTGGRGVGGADISIPSRPNQDSGRWGFQIGPDGDVSFDSTGAHAVLNSLFSKRGGYWADVNHGKRFAGESITSGTATQERANSLEALEPIVQDGTISDVSVDVLAPPSSVGVLATDVFWNSGQLSLGFGNGSDGAGFGAGVFELFGGGGGGGGGGS